MSFRWPLLSDENDDTFKEFCDLFTYYLCIECCKGTVDHPRKDEWHEYGHHHGELLLKIISSAKKVDPFEGLMSAYATYLESDPKIFLEDKLAKAFTDGHPNIDRKTSLFLAAQFIHSNISDIFIIHGIEKLDKFSYKASDYFPPNESMLESSLSKDRLTYAIDTDQIPLIYCASTHYGHQCPWIYLKGIIPYSKFKTLGGVVKIPPDREHFYAESQIALGEWCFIYFRKPRAYKSLQFDLETMRQTISEIKRREIAIIEFETLQSFLRTMSLLQQKLTIAEKINR